MLNPALGVFSVFAWIKGGAPGQVVISQMDGASMGAIWLSADPTDGKLMTRLMPHAIGLRVPPQPLVSEFVITDGDWHRVGFVWDGSDRILYVDGLEVARDTQTGLGSSEGGLYLGASSTLEPGSFFSGLIDDVRIYSEAITP
ncbi:MAG: LamG domain-containing protein [Phycisphaerales bacterium]|nr:MAG: LamG domain-containing protein [Phycisphaerales bacterium]